MYSSSGRTAHLNRLADSGLKIKPNNGLIKTPTIGSGNVSGSHPLSNHPKRPRDLNQWAKRMVDIATGAVEDREPTPEEQGKDPAAVSLGRRGGLKGGNARTASLTPEKRREIAQKAAASRWASADKKRPS
jgi:hypothetical protein